MAKVNSISEIGDLGLIVFDGEGYFYVTEEQWKALKPSAAPATRDPVLVGVFDEGKAIFVNLDRLGMAPTENT